MFFAEGRQASAEHAKLSVQFEPDYPRVLELTRQIQSIDSSIARETSRIAQARQREYVEARFRESELKAKVEALKSELDRQNRANIQYGNYQREADTNRQLYDALLQRYKEIGVAGAVGVNNIAIVEPAITPDKPSSPKIFVNIIISLLLGLGLPARHRNRSAPAHTYPAGEQSADNRADRSSRRWAGPPVRRPSQTGH